MLLAQQSSYADVTYGWSLRQMEEQRIKQQEEMKRREKAFLQEQIRGQGEIDRLNSIIQSEEMVVRKHIESDGI